MALLESPVSTLNCGETGEGGGDRGRRGTPEERGKGTVREREGDQEKKKHL